jgi:hypothetical protein
MEKIASIPLSKIVSSFIILSAIGFAIYILIRDDIFIEISKLEFNFGPLLVSFFLAFIGTFLVAIPVWRKILIIHNVRLKYQDDAQIYSYSALGTLLPGRIWTMAGRAALYKQRNQSALKVTVASIMESIIIGVSALILFSGIAIVRPEISLWESKPFVGIGIILGCIFLIHPRIFKHILAIALRFSDKQNSSILNNYKLSDLYTWLLFEILVICFGGLAIYALLMSIQPSTSLDLLLPVIAAWAAGVAVGNLLFLLPGTPIFRDGAMVIALTPFMPLASAILFTGLVRIWTIVSLLLFAGISWLLFNRNGIYISS